MCGILKSIIIGAVVFSTVNLSVAGTIKFTYMGDEFTRKFFTEIKKEYETKYPDRKVTLIPIFRSGGQQVEKMTLMLKNDSTIDAARPSEEVINMASGKIIAPLDNINDWDGWKEYYPSLKKSVTYKGKVYGIPMATETRFIYYNKDIFRKAGIEIPWQPKNWQDIIDTAKKIKAKVPNVIPIWMEMARNMFQTMFIMATDYDFYRDGKFVVTSKGLLEALTFIDTLVKNKLTDKPYNMLNPEACNIMEKEYMPKGKAAMIFFGSWLTRSWIGKNADLKDKYGMALVPTNKGQKPHFITMSNYSFMAVNAISKKKAEAFEFIKFASTKENSLKVSQILGDLSPRMDTVKMKDYPEDLKVPSEYLKYTHFGIQAPNAIAVIIELSNAFQQVALGSKTPKEAMNQYAVNVELTIGKNRIIREYKE
jgi:multiple sugar transport system substrate-binding protein